MTITTVSEAKRGMDGRLGQEMDHWTNSVHTHVGVEKRTLATRLCSAHMVLLGVVDSRVLGVRACHAARVCVCVCPCACRPVMRPE
mmetsp:Transcript_28528/g.82249  ORF Transcript_28528/g.82249 Transcript_28528/m.82249 type:complete len:86 (+) Transcript_28528:424-681(+)